MGSFNITAARVLGDEVNRVHHQLAAQVVVDANRRAREAADEANRRRADYLHCVGNVASEGIKVGAAGFGAGASAGAAAGGFLLGPAGVPVGATAGGVFGLSLGTRIGINQALQTPACRVTFGMPR